MEGNQVGTLYKLSITPVPPSSSPETNPTPSIALAATSSRDADLVLWHNRMGHVSIHTIKTMSEQDSVHDLPILSNSKLLQVCTGCALGKQHKSFYPSNPTKERAKIPGEMLHADLCGKMSTPSLGGAHYYILIKDDCTSFRFVAFLKAKGDAIRFFIRILRYIEKVTGNAVKTLRTDRGKEFCNNEFDLLLEHEGITRETSTSYTPQQNGYVERDNRTICEAARSMLHLYDLPLKLWAESIHTAVYILNRTINHQVGYKTPYELWFNSKPSVSHFKTFGTLAYIFIDKSQRTKFQPKGSRVIFVGYSNTSKGWRFWNPLTDKITESSDVIFDEATAYSSSLFASPSQVDIPSSLFFPSNSPPTIQNPPQPPQPNPPLVPIVPPVGVSSTTDSLPSFEMDSPTISLNISDPSSPTLPPQPVHEHEHASPDSVSSDPYDIDIPYTPHVLDEPVQPKYKSLTDIYTDSSDPFVPTSIFSSTSAPPSSSPVSPVSHVSSHSSPTTSFVNMVHSAATYREPATYKQATMSPQAAYWKATMEREYDSLMENHTWTLVPPPPGRTIVQCKWVYKIKYTSTGAIDKYKARLVAKGYS